MVVVKRGTFELLNYRGNYDGPLVNITCGERNGNVAFYTFGGVAHVVSFNVDIQKTHATQHLLEQLFEYLLSLGNIIECVFEPSLSEDFDILLKRNGCELLQSDGLYHGRLSRSLGLKKYISDDLGINDYHQERPRLHFNFDCRFQMNLGQEFEERSPTLHAYISQNASIQVVKFPLELDSNGIAQGTLQFWYDLYNKDVPHTTRWNLAFFTEIRNKHGEFCVNQAGNASIPLAKLLGICSKLVSSSANSGTSPSKNIVFSLQVPASPQVEKGKIFMILKQDSVRLENALMSQQILHEISPQNFNNEVNKYISSVVDTYKSIPPLYDGIRNIHAFTYVGPMGTLPATFYQRFKVPPCSESYWLNALEIVLARDGLMDLQRFSAGEGGEKYASRMLAEVCALYVNYCKYITDKVLKTSPPGRSRAKRSADEQIESFDLVRPRNAGDCEDDAKEIQIESFQLKLSFYEPDAHPALKRLHDIRNKYYAFSALGAVSSATINGDYGEQQFGAHEWLVFVPKDWFMKCVERATPSSPFVLKEDEGVGSDLEVMVVEGTGMLRPDGEGQEMFPKGRDYIENIQEGRSAFSNLRRIYFYNRVTGSNFYKVVITLYTNEFFLDQSSLPHIGEFIVETTNQGKPAYGAPFIDFITKKDTVRISPQKAIPPELYYHISIAQEDEYPILPLDPPSNPSKQVSPTDALYPLVEYSSRARTESREWNLPVEYFMRFDQGTQERVSEILSVLESTGSYVDIHREPVSGDSVGGWRILVYLPTEVVS